MEDKPGDTSSSGFTETISFSTNTNPIITTNANLISNPSSLTSCLNQNLPPLDRLYPQCNKSILPKRWNKKDMSEHLYLSNDGLRVHYRGPGQTHADAAAVRTHHEVPFQTGIYYYEVKIISKGRNGYISIGLSSGSVSLSRLPGWDKKSFGYHGDDGCAFASHGEGDAYGPKFTTDDIIGCGFDIIKKEIFFTKNGKNLGPAFKNVNINYRLYPTMGLRHQTEIAQANFGQTNFVYNIDDYIESRRIRINNNILESERCLRQYADQNSYQSNFHYKPPGKNKNNKEEPELGIYQEELMLRLISNHLMHSGYFNTIKTLNNSLGSSAVNFEPDLKKNLIELDRILEEQDRIQTLRRLEKLERDNNLEKEEQSMEEIIGINEATTDENNSKNVDKIGLLPVTVTPATIIPSPIEIEAAPVIYNKRQSDPLTEPKDQKNNNNDANDQMTDDAEQQQSFDQILDNLKIKMSCLNDFRVKWYHAIMVGDVSLVIDEINENYPEMMGLEVLPMIVTTTYDDYEAFDYVDDMTDSYISQTSKNNNNNSNSKPKKFIASNTPQSLNSVLKLRQFTELCSKHDQSKKFNSNEEREEFLLQLGQELGGDNDIIENPNNLTILEEGFNILAYDAAASNNNKENSQNNDAVSCKSEKSGCNSSVNLGSQLTLNSEISQNTCNDNMTDQSLTQDKNLTKKENNIQDCLDLLPSQSQLISMISDSNISNLECLEYLNNNTSVKNLDDKESLNRKNTVSSLQSFDSNAVQVAQSSSKASTNSNSSPLNLLSSQQVTNLASSSNNIFQRVALNSSPTNSLPVKLPSGSDDHNHTNQKPTILRQSPLTIQNNVNSILLQNQNLSSLPQPHDFSSSNPSTINTVDNNCLNFDVDNARKNELNFGLMQSSMTDSILWNSQDDKVGVGKKELEENDGDFKVLSFFKHFLRASERKLKILNKKKPFSQIQHPPPSRTRTPSQSPRRHPPKIPQS